MALAVSALKEIKGCIDDTDGLRHSVTGELLTDEWLFAYLRRAIDFRYAPQEEHRDGRNEKDGQVPEWLPDMIVAYGQDFSEKMWRHW